MRADAEARTVTVPPATDDAGTGDRPVRPRRRRALYAATVLASLGGVALLAVGRTGGLAPMLPVQEAAAQQPPPPAGDAEPPLQPQQQPLPPVTATTPAAADAVAGGALGALIEQANFWRSQQGYDQAVTSLNRALELAPNNADALVLMAQVQSEKGDQRAAMAAFDRLRQVAPGDARIEKLGQTLRVGPISQDQLAEARRLAQSGKQAEAVQRYNRVFKGNPPPDALAVEYYQTLAGAEGGYDQAKEGLARLVRQNPQDLRAQLAYAQVLTYRDATRLEGVQRLTALAQSSAVADQATQSWRQALGWLSDTKDSIPPLQAYLASHPGDTGIANKLEQVKNPLMTASLPERARIQGFDALNQGKLADAEKLFQKAVDADANDADATGGLGLVRLRQHNLADAKTLLARAIALDPEHKGRWQAALTAASNPGGGPNPAVALINRGDFASAERELSRQIAQGGDVTGLQGMLADAQARQGRLDEAEATYRAALGRSPNNGQLLVGLAGVLSRQGRGREASDALDRVQAVGGSSRLVGQARALQLREQANAVTDPATRVGLYRAAVAADPDSPWLRLDLARALFRLGQANEARALMAEVIGASPTTDALKAGIIFANETSDPDTAAALLARLPAAMRTPEMRTLQVQADLQRQIGAALMFSRPMARQRLLAMSTIADPDGARGAALARALGGIGDTFAAREAVVAAQASTPRQGAGAKLRYAGALLDVDDAAGASDMLAQIGPGIGLSAAERQQFVQLQAGLAVRTSDKLNEQGRQADAYDRLAPLLAQAPENPDLNLALARLYTGARNPREALQISEALLRRDPSNVDARKGAVEAALQLGDRRLADSLVQAGQRLTPNDPKTWMMSSELEKARGNNGRALRDLERARDLRLQQLGYSGADAGADGGPQTGVSLVPGATPTYAPAAPQPVYRPMQVPNADGGADQPQGLSAPPMLGERATSQAAPLEMSRPDAALAVAGPAPPFTPQPTNAVGVPPTYQPAADDDVPPHPLLDTSATDLVPPTYAPQPYAPQPSAPQPYAPQYSQQYPPLYPQPYPTQDQPYPPTGAAVRPAAPFPVRPLAAPGAAPGYYDNPFRQNPAGTLDDGTALTAPGAAAPDPMTEQIDHDIIALRDTVAPSAQAGFGFRTRSGSSGLDALNELTVPMEATFSPGGYGQLKLTVTPTVLTSGTVGGDISNQQRFGTNALALRTNTTTGLSTLAGASEPDQHANGLGLDVGYTTGNVSADIGSSPFGFLEQTVVGGFEWAPQLSDHVRLRLLAERRALPDSLLSFAGTTDPRTGEKWGGVVQDHARATLEFSAGKADFYVLGGGAEFTGTHVQNNTEFEGGAGGSYPIYRTTDQEVRVGLDLIYFGFQHNQDFFTLGQGGYFSPQSFIAAMIPVIYKETVDEDFSYEVGAAAGYSSYRESAQPYYPIDSALQAQLVAQQAGSNAAAGVLTQYPGLSQAGFQGTAHASLDYRVSPSLHLGAKVNFQHATNFDETIGMVYAKYLFNGADK